MVDYYDEIRIGTNPDGSPIYIHTGKIRTTTNAETGETHVTLHATLL